MCCFVVVCRLLIVVVCRSLFVVGRCSLFDVVVCVSVFYYVFFAFYICYFIRCDFLFVV